MGMQHGPTCGGGELRVGMHTLAHILRRMQEHHAKKRPLLRAPKAWLGVGKRPRHAGQGVRAQQERADEALSRTAHQNL